MIYTTEQGMVDDEDQLFEAARQQVTETKTINQVILGYIDQTHEGGILDFVDRNGVIPFAIVLDVLVGIDEMRVNEARRHIQAQRAVIDGMIDGAIKRKIREERDTTRMLRHLREQADRHPIPDR